ncbi:RNA pseudouridylate synthase family protein [Mycobacteroides abscessus MAB_082312_2272]|uniref:RNA pseudouridylate synthase n=1 Tax=Mycobacteroides abscessus MAB_091912_2446 TaxID=1335414 RepID=A0A829MKN0_9MYCO|nr:RNA pseudouridylate synthase family protein [Mycobacteroides abscessus MAB_082312_2258]ESV64888.1 RNA pseudouridylate synthase family protein [Mycobacteroides abscessus MAB_091912_2446]ETZ78386.1 RNA pseudouridylate synthase family protein [Mycobacteroides abscessus MAB_082312_2272]ETZ83247.1 RNA pseudouridylate synthase family protein [Mycobacteroides abscessus MAB_091912_2455]CPT15431.1 ribosomal large subunit pseudouridine synthase A [Mycobacteroides abscessus]
MVDELAARFGPAAVDQVVRGEVVDSAGERVTAGTRLPAGAVVYTYREPAEEISVPFAIDVLHWDENVLVVDKPHFLATMPRGRHVTETALVRLRKMLDLPELAPAHRLDRLTAGVLLFTVRRDVRSAYHALFAQRQVVKIYEALAPVKPGLSLPLTLRSRIVKRRSILQAVEEPGPVNAETRVELVDRHDAVGRYRLTPSTGQTHQLRVHMNSMGVPILNDPLYPDVVELPPDDFTRPLQLLARTLAFRDPLNGKDVRYESGRALGQ